MKIVCDKNTLLNAISTVLKAISSRSTLSILQCILIETNKDTITLTGNDLELAIATTIKAEVIESGTVAINSKIFSEIIRKLPDSEVQILEDEYIMNIICAKSEFNIPCQNPNNYVKIPMIEKNRPLKIQQKVFKEMIQKTIFSTAVEEIRPALTGEMLEINNNKMTIFSVDGFRASVASYELEEPYKNLKTIIPGKTMTEISKVLNDNDEEINVYFSDKHLLLEFNNTILVSRTLIGEFPDHKVLFVKDYDTKIKVNREQMLHALERASLIASESKNKPVRFKVTKQGLALFSNTEAGKVYEEINIDFEGNELEIAFNPKYILNVLKAISDEEATITFTTSFNPCIFRDYENNSYEYLILPIRLGEY